MKMARDPANFWRYSTLFAKIVDPRYDLWKEEYDPPEEVFVRFFPTIEDRINDRIKKWQSKRQSKLFGQDVPDPIF
jgi:hypothetical protein